MPKIKENKLICPDCDSPLSLIIHEDGRKSLCCMNLLHSAVVTHKDLNKVYDIK